MRCEAYQMARMALDEQFGEAAGEIARRQEDWRQRIRREAEREREETQWPLDADCF